MRPKQTALRLASMPFLLAVAACGGGGGGGEGDAEAAKAGTPIVIGTKGSPEQRILGELYRQTLEARGYSVSLRSNVGPTEVIDRALASGEINFYPEYTGTTVTVIFGYPAGKTAEKTHEIARKVYEGRGQTLLRMTPFSASEALAVRKEDADANGLKAIGDLKSFKGGAFRLGAPPGFSIRLQGGLAGLEQNYELLQLELVTLDGIGPYGALDQKQVDAAVIFATDPQLAGGKYVVLEDPVAQFVAQNIAPVVDQDLAVALGEELAETVDAVSEKLTGEAMIAMNAAVAIEQRQPEDVAKQFLDENGLL